jgi:hypothetical protein
LEILFSVLVLDNSFLGHCSSLDEASGEAMSAMKNLFIELTTAMEHTSKKLTEATESGDADIMEATCNVSIEFLQICAYAFAQVRQGSSNGN